MFFIRFRAFTGVKHYAKKSITCPKCQTAMERGFVPDHSYTHAFQPEWCSGTPQETKFLGFAAGIKTKQLGSTSQPISFPLIAYRCPECTLVEWYAPQK